MTEKFFVWFVVVMGLLTASRPVQAHHGTSAYAEGITQLRQVTVTKFLWGNPHSLIDFDAKSPDGKVVHWVCETAAPQALRLIGWSKASLQPGDVITIYMYAAKNGNPVGRLQKIVLADGSELHDTVLGSDAGGKTRYDPNSSK